MFEIKFSKKEQFPGRGHCIELYGDYVTERVWHAVKQMVECNITNHEFYKAKEGFCVFFQGGYDNPHGKWILLEFWVDDIEKTREFIRLLTITINRVLVERFTQICVNPNQMGYVDGEGAYTVLGEIHKETGCHVNWGSPTTPITFYPENNLEHRKVLDLCKAFELPVTKWV